MALIPPEISGPITNVLVFFFAKIMPVFWAGHDYLATRIGDWIGHPEIARGLANFTWIISTVGIWYLFDLYIHVMQKFLKYVLYLIALVLVSMAAWGAVEIARMVFS